MRQAIQTKFIPCTNTRPSRVKATAEAGSVILSWDHALNSEQNHTEAAHALARKFGWAGVYFGGGFASGYVFVNADIADDAFTVSQAEALAIRNNRKAA